MTDLENIFNITFPKTLTFCNMEIDPNGINFVSSKGTNNGVVDKVKRKPGITVYPAGAITVPLKGSVLEASLQIEDFYIAHQTAVLTPKTDMTIQQKIYYMLFIRQNKQKYNYGRQADRTIKNIQVPSLEEIPEWVNEIEIPNFDYIKEAKNQDKVELPDFNQWKNFKYNDIFIMNRGKGGKATDAKNNPGINHYIGASDISNGITQCTSLPTTEQGNSITVANNGSVGAAFYQPVDFLASSDVTVLTLKTRELTPQIALFLCTLIRQEGIKVNYGRKWGISRMRESIISLPVNDQGEPDWQLMEDYINSLPYSATL